MEPTYHSGDLLLVRSADDLRVGDVAVYRVPSGVGAGQHIVHRIVGISDGAYELRGDAKSDSDEFRPRSADVVGRPVLDLGPLPLRLLSLAPLLAGVVVALTIGWLLWPAPRPVPAARATARPDT